MPYSLTQFCVSPSNVGNYAAQCSRPMADETAADRCLTVLNSWTAGDNTISQQVKLNPGKYRVLLDMKYECTNEISNDGKKVVASGNTNTSLTGLRYGSTTDYRFPDQRASWQTLCYDFELKEETSVTVSIGFSTSSGVGAANNTLLYVDNVRLLASNENDPTALNAIQATETDGTLYTLSGIKVPSHKIQSLPAGIYVSGQKKLLKK